MAVAFVTAIPITQAGIRFIHSKENVTCCGRPVCQLEERDLIAERGAV
jgi:hypothetical protein